MRIQENKKEIIMARLKEQFRIAEEYDYETVGIFLQGSQNYNLDTEESDIDSKVIVVPKFDDFLLNKKPVSHTHIMENDEHVDFKDIRLMFNCFKKQNINFIEILFTDYYILNPEYEQYWLHLRDFAENIAIYDVARSLSGILGMAYEKKKALTHPYPTTAWKIEKYGYDPKQLHHILRLREFIERYVSGEPYAQCLQSEMREDLTEVKQGMYTLEEAIKYATANVEAIKKIKDGYIETHPELKKDESIEKILNQTMSNIIKASFIKELRGDAGL